MRIFRGSAENSASGFSAKKRANSNRKECEEIVDKIDTKEEIDALVKATEKTREELKKSWKKVEDLDAAIQKRPTTTQPSQKSN